MNQHRMLHDIDVRRKLNVVCRTTYRLKTLASATVPKSISEDWAEYLKEEEEEEETDPLVLPDTCIDSVISLLFV